MAQKYMQPFVREEPLAPHLTSLELTEIDRNAATLEATTEDGQQIAALFLFEDILWLSREATRIAVNMIAQLRAAPFGARQAAEIMRRGARVDIGRSPVTFDPASKECRVLLQLDKHGPLPLVLTEADIELLRAKVRAARAQASATQH